MTTHQSLVKEFMIKAGQNVSDKPTIPTREIRLLRARLIMEECLEAIEALGVNIEDGEIPIVFDCMHFYVINDDINLTEVAKELADISVVAEAGTGIACGIDMEPVIDAVDKNNLGKFGEGSYKDEFGKHCKPPNYPKPDIESIINEQIHI
jgi:predicted HAD superfamily Cof-like phosphohydrolase